jgi:NADH-quinone oxidoreductase subunit L
VHLGAFLLLRASPLLDASMWLSAAVVLIGLATAIYAHQAAGVQTDIKSALSFASLVQVGIIVAEIGLGFRYLPLFHLLGHACLRTLQFVRAPSLLEDYRRLEDAIGDHLSSVDALSTRRPADRANLWLYRWSLERGNLDSLLSEFVIRPFVRTMRSCDDLERRFTDFVSHGPSRESDASPPPFGTIDEFT